MLFFFFDKYKDELTKALQLTNIRQIVELKDFYFEKAKDKFEEFQGMETEDIDLSALINAVRFINKD